MEVVYAPEAPPSQFTKSIFLAGPSPRDPAQPNWRPEALAALEAMGYDGVVLGITRSGWLGRSSGALETRSSPSADFSMMEVRRTASMSPPP